MVWDLGGQARIPGHWFRFQILSGLVFTQRNVSGTISGDSQRLVEPEQALFTSRADAQHGFLIFLKSVCAQSCPTLGNTPGSSVPGIFTARILEQVAIFLLQGPSYPGIKPVSLVSPAWLADSLPQPTWFKRVSMCSFSVEQVRQVIIDPRLDKTHLGLHGHHTGGKTQTRTHAFKSIIQEGVQGSLGPNTSPPRPGGPRIH